VIHDRELPAAIRVLPRRQVSRAVGALVRMPVPPWLLAPILRVYARQYGANLEEAERPPGGWRSFLAFFTRHLADGARPLPDDPAVIVSPADGRVHTAGPVAAGRLLQAKGIDYALDELLGDADEARLFEGGTQLTVYLSPGDYHRFHWPLDGTIHTVRHLPGDLWPVHTQAVATKPGLFAVNERVVASGEAAGGGAFAVVAVGALNVGSIRLSMHPVRTNRDGPARVRAWPGLDVRVARGEEMGWFEMGSTLVVLLAPETGTLDPLAAGAGLRVGEPVGRIRESAAS